ncbi:hypothetical protein ACFX12_035263 [Malus domestica]
MITIPLLLGTLNSFFHPPPNSPPNPTLSHTSITHSNPLSDTPIPSPVSITHPLTPISSPIPLPLPSSHPTLLSPPISTPPVTSLPPTPLLPPLSTTSSTLAPPTIHPMVTRAKDGISKPNPKYAHTSTITAMSEPTCYSQANKFQEWRTAMADEFNALQRAGTWSLVPYTPTMNVLPNKWVFRLKRKSDGSIDRFKARLVANGFHQQPGLDYGETFSPVVTHSTIRLIIAMAVHFSWPIRQLDVQNFFYMVPYLMKFT